MVTLGRETDLSSLWPRDASMLKQGLIGGATLIVHRRTLRLTSEATFELDIFDKIYPYKLIMKWQ